MKRIISFLLSVIIALAFSTVAFAGSPSTVTYLEDDVNPRYSGVQFDNVSDKRKMKLAAPISDINEQKSAPGDTIYLDYKSAAKYARDCMVARKTSFSVNISKLPIDNLTDVYKYTKDDYPHLYILYGAFSDGVSEYSYDGDYLASIYNRAYDCTVNDNTTYKTYNYNIEYRTTAEQEKVVADFVSDFISGIDAHSLSRLDLIKAAHDKICEVTDYDYETYNNINNGISVDLNTNTAYSAIANGKTLCEGYSTLFYRICKELDIPVRIVESETHAWNIVKPYDGLYYYNIDLTWDDEPATDGIINAPYDCKFYLKSSDDVITFKSHRGEYYQGTNSSHYRIDYYDSEYFNEHYPICGESYYLEDEHGKAVCPYCKTVISGAVPSDEVPDIKEPTTEEPEYETLTVPTLTDKNSTQSTAAQADSSALPQAKTVTKLTLKKVTVKRNAKKLVLQATLKVNGKAVKGKKIVFKFNGRKYTAKTNSKGVAKVTVKKSVLKKLKKGKKISYQASYGKAYSKRTTIVK